VRIAKTILVIAALWGIAADGRAQQAAATPPLKRTVLQQVDISIPGREAITALAELQPKAVAGRHSHPGEEIGYVSEGAVLVEIDGKPGMTLNAGQMFFIPAGAIHNATNPTAGVVKIIATYLVEKGKPLATPAPAK
jgi:quercetin dioxygenase-like cupin family protein